MNPVNLFSSILAKPYLLLMVAIFTYHFFIKYKECGDVMESLKYAGRITLL
ncbi:MAG: hypothetical protein IPN18_12475 [Ignavibacteriales bacterium]|nr:hypothetical protein [Ignavibacteriales bacterium]